MRRYPVMNIARPMMGQARSFDILDDRTLGRICQAIDAFNKWGDFSDTPTGDRYRRDAIADVQSIIDNVPASIRNGAVDEIRQNCDNADELLDHIHKPTTSTPPAIPSSQTGVATGDTSRTPPPPPPNENPPVATGQPGPGRGAFKGQGYPSIATGTPGPGYGPPSPPETPVTTGSEPEPMPPQPPPPPPPPPAPPAVASVANGCWYVMGQGYSWGPRPSGGESTGLSQKDCENLITLDRQVRGLPVATQGTAQTTQQSTVSQQTMTPTQAASSQPPAPPQENAPVATGGPGSCGPGQFWDGTRCRGSVASVPGGYGGVAFGGGGGATMPGGGLPGGGSEGLTAFGMGRRFPVKNIIRR